MDDHMDIEHEGRWKLFDPDVLQLGDEVHESDFDDSSCSEDSIILMMKNQKPKVWKKSYHLSILIFQGECHSLSYKNA